MSFPFGQHIYNNTTQYLSSVIKSNGVFNLSKNVPYYIQCKEETEIIFNNQKMKIQQPGLLYIPIDNGILQTDGQSATSITVSSINNIIPYKSQKFLTLSKIGIQATPGQMFCLNQSSLKIDGSGIFEYEGDINFIGFVPLANSNIFILDYKIKE